MRPLLFCRHFFAVICVALSGFAHATAGDLDVTFGVAGKVMTQIGSGALGYGMVLQADGNILLAGSCGSASKSNFCLVRYNVNGSVDTDFAATGKIITAVGTLNDYAVAVAIQTDGNIVTVGYCQNSSNNFDFCVTRHTRSGSLDSSFGNAGRVVTTVGNGDDYATKVFLQPDGKIVVLGYCMSGSGYWNFCLVRYSANGSLDSTFGSGGKVTTALGSGHAVGTAAVLQSDGKILIAGSCANAFGGRGFCLARYGTNGSLDIGFNGNGKVLPDGTAAESSVVFDIALQLTGKSVVVGHCTTGGRTQFCAARYNPSGSLDISFGSSGRLATSVGTAYDIGQGVAVQVDGKILLAGYCGNDANEDFCLVRFDLNGAIDTNFGIGGKVIAPVGSGDDSATSIALQSDGKIVLGGYCSEGADTKFCLARFRGASTNCRLDIDGDGKILATTDGLIYTRIALGISGSAVLNGVTFPLGAVRTSWADIRSYLVDECGLSLGP